LNPLISSRQKQINRIPAALDGDHAFACGANGSFAGFLPISTGRRDPAAADFLSASGA
jgi:hypothetical protein